MRAYVLAGGASRRMGVDKRLVEVRGVAMLSRVVAAASNAHGIEEAVIVARHGESPVPGVRIIADSRSGQGAMIGIETALTDALPGAQALVLACDYPLLAPSTLERLVAAAREREDRITLVANDEGIHPLVAVWPTAALTLVRSSIDEGRLRVTDLARAVGFHEISVHELLADPEQLNNVNRPVDLERVRSIDVE